MGRVDFSDSVTSIWTPSITFAQLRELNNLSKQLFLYPDGKVTLKSRDKSIISCTLKYKLFPKDEHSCEFTVISDDLQTSEIEFIYDSSINIHYSFSTDSPLQIGSSYLFHYIF